MKIMKKNCKINNSPLDPISEFCQKKYDFALKTEITIDVLTRD